MKKLSDRFQYYSGILCATGMIVDINDLVHISALLEAEEQGLLLKLPARNVFESSGDAVYYIYDYEIVECINCGISLDCEGVMWITLGCDENIFQYRNMIAGIDTDPTDCCSKTTDVRIDEWGKTVFLTKEEAEAKLKELKNE